MSKRSTCRQMEKRRQDRNGERERARHVTRERENVRLKVHSP